MMASLLTQSFCWLAFILLSQGSSLDSNPCGDWTTFKNEKCVKLVDQSGFQNKQDAEIICRALRDAGGSGDVPKLVTAKNEEEQQFLQKLFFEDLGIIDNVWLGLDLVSDNVYRWNDGTELSYTNWVEKYYADRDQNCVQMESGDGPYDTGKWTKANCKKRNAVVCEKNQPWSVSSMQNMLSNMKLEMEKMKQETENMKQELEKNKQESEHEIANLKKYPVPVGFVYVQLPGKDSPFTLWPQAVWQNVGAQYSGLFFRVEGLDAAAFGELQEDNTRRLGQVYYNYLESFTNPEIPPDGSWSGFVFTGSRDCPGSQTGISFSLTKGEVRPRNKAVKIWQRIR